MTKDSREEIEAVTEGGILIPTQPKDLNEEFEDKAVSTPLELLKVLRKEFAPGWMTSPEGREYINVIDETISVYDKPEYPDDVKALNHTIVSSAILQFVAWLTGNEKVIKVGSSETVYDIMEASKEFAAHFNLIYDTSLINEWPKYLGQRVDPWTPRADRLDNNDHPSGSPDAQEWAKYFVTVFPGMKDKEDVMLSWFANVAMAMHDWVYKMKVYPLTQLVEDLMNSQGELIKANRDFLGVIPTSDTALLRDKIHGLTEQVETTSKALYNAVVNLNAAGIDTVAQTEAQEAERLARAKGVLTTAIESTYVDPDQSASPDETFDPQAEPIAGKVQETEGENEHE